MRSAVIMLVALVCAALSGQAAPREQALPPSPFVAVDVVIDTGDVSLAVYQIELQGNPGDVRIVGVEGSAHPAFADPPYHDPAAIQGERLVIGAFSTERDLPAGRTRIATVHVERLGDAPPHFDAVLVVCADPNGEPIHARLTLTSGDGS